MDNKAKKILSLLILLVVLVIVWLVWQNPFTSDDNKNEVTIISTEQIDNISKIEISQGENTTVLNKKDSVWLVESAEKENVEANQTLINGLFDALKQARLGVIVSDNPDKFATFNLTAEQAKKLKIYDNQENLLLDLMIGKTALSGLNQTYIKLTDQDKIILVNANLVTATSQPDWKKPPPVEMDNEAAVELDADSIKTQPIE